MTTIAIVAGAVALLAAGIAGGRLWQERRARSRREGAESEAEELLESARREAESLRREAELAGKEKAYQQKVEWEEEVQRRRAELAETEKRLAEREEMLDEKLSEVDRRQARQEERMDKLEAREEELRERAEELARREAETRERLESLAGLTADEARERLVSRIEDEARAEAEQHVRELRERTRRDAEKEARKIISMAIEKLAVDQASDATVSVVSLPSDDMKGRIIGREGRNIRAFEAATGVDVVVDDTPEAVLLSCFDPIRREVARLAMERLVADGRIHPGRIEEMVEKAREEVQSSIGEAAEEVLYELGVHDLHPHLKELLGRLRYRTSYGQNQLQHAREVALLAGGMAAELGLDVQMAKRMGLLHDVGKALTHEHEGSHVELGHQVAEEHGEPDQVLNAIRAHHDEEPARYPESFLVTAADAISGARPGARRESFENYVKRLEKLESLAASYEGVEKVYAIQAGREIRVMVMPDEVDDEEMTRLSEETARRIEDELQYPGQIKVVVVRETRAVDFAR
jgi:ribonuclease Y